MRFIHINIEEVLKYKKTHTMDETAREFDISRSALYYKIHGRKPPVVKNPNNNPLCTCGCGNPKDDKLRWLAYPCWKRRTNNVEYEYKVNL